MEDQVKVPIESAEEMANTVEEFEKRLNADSTYRENFSRDWGSGRIKFEMVAKKYCDL